MVGMANRILNSIIHFLDIFFGFVAGFSLIDLISTVNPLQTLDGIIKLLTAIFGLVYFGLRIFFYVKDKTHEHKIKNHDLELKKLELIERKHLSKTVMNGTN